MKFGYAARSFADLVQHVKTSFRLEGRSHMSRGMKNPHDAYMAGYNQAVDDISEVLEQTRIVPNLDEAQG